jgi:hypothetical protein
MSIDYRRLRDSMKKLLEAHGIDELKQRLASKPGEWACSFAIGTFLPYGPLFRNIGTRRLRAVLSLSALW